MALMSDWSKRLDAQILFVMRRLPAPPLWLLLMLQLIAFVLFGFFLWKVLFP